MARSRKNYRVEELERVLEAAIRRGDLPSGERLPTERDMAERYECSRNTVRKAVHMLHQRGMLTYSSRRYRVTKSLDNIVFLDQMETREGIAVFLNLESSVQDLLREIERTVRAAGYHPQVFSLDGVGPGDEKNADFSPYLNSLIRGAIFLGARYGAKAKAFREEDMDVFPLPHVFLNEKPNFPTRRYLETDANVMAAKTMLYVRERALKNVTLLMPWPLPEREAALLKSLSQDLAREIDYDAVNVRFHPASSPIGEVEGIKPGSLIIIPRTMRTYVPMMAKRGDVLLLDVDGHPDCYTLAPSTQVLVKSALAMLSPEGGTKRKSLPARLRPPMGKKT